MRFPSKIRFIDKKVQKSFYVLNNKKEFKNLFKQINKVLDLLQEDAFCGIQIPKRLIPLEYVKKYNIKNLWKYNLSKGWRLLYSVESEGIIIVTILLEWLDHKSYEKRFKY